MLSVPFVEKKVSSACIRDLGRHCWYAHDAFSHFWLLCVELATFL